MNAETGLQFVDTNILVYAYDYSAGQKFQQARQLVQSLWASGAGCLSIQVLQEFYVTITQKVSSPLEASKATTIISDLAFWRVHAPEAADVLGAVDLQQRYTISFWDGMIIRSALQLGCNTVWSEDLNSGQVYDGLTALNPFSD
jgi:predicted nucleic acid-binding protein